MGAEEFTVVGKGKTANEAFRNAKQEAQYEHGHGGYTGTIAEKHGFRLITCKQDPELIEAKVEQCLSSMNHFCTDKWGDAGAIKMSKNEWVFFGVASS